MALHPLATQFAAVAEDYERGRPDYAPAVAGAFAAELGLGAGAPVLDLGAGTGKLTRARVAPGLDVSAVEPQPELRALLAGFIGDGKVLDGVAEAIPLADGAVDAVFVADAFHWFDREPALKEIARVVRPGGGLALVSMAPDWGEAPWGHAVGEVISRLRTAHPFFDGAPFTESLAAAPDWSPPRDVCVITRQPIDTARIESYVRSFSWVAAMSDDARQAMLDEIRSLVGEDMRAELPVRCFAWLSVRA